MMLLKHGGALYNSGDRGSRILVAEALEATFINL